MIQSFGDQDTEDLYHGRDTRGVRRFPPAIIHTARRKLDMIAAAYQLNDLRVPPGNRLEALKGNYEVCSAFASMTNGASCSGGRNTAPVKCGLSTIINFGRNDVP